MTARALASAEHPAREAQGAVGPPEGQLHRGDSVYFENQGEPLHKGAVTKTVLMFGQRDIALPSIYFDELHWHCTTIAERRKTVDEILASSSTTRYRLGDEYILVEPALLTALTEVILAASNIKKIINPDTERRGMTKAAHDHLLQRAQNFSDLVAGLPISEIYNAKSRNALEHFDRELDKYSRRAEREKGAPHELALLNITLSTRSTLNFMKLDEKNLETKDILFLRAYIVDTSTFIAFDEEVDIGKLYFEADLIEKRLQELGGNEPQAGRVFLLPQVQKKK